MKTISLAVSEDDYAVFREAAERDNRSIAQLIRDAMALYRAQRLEPRSRLDDVPVLLGHRPLGELPSREDLYDEAFGERGSHR